MTFITWACLRCVQELATILGPQNPTQRSCVLEATIKISTKFLKVLELYIKVFS